MIIALKKQDKIFVATGINDGSINMTEKDLLLSENIPFWKINGVKDCYVGVRDVSYSADLLRYNNYVFKNITDIKSIIDNVIPKMKDLLGKYDMSGDGKNWRNRLVIIKDDRIYEVDNFFSVEEEDEYAVLTIGYDTDYIKGALDESKDLSAEESILNALRSYSLMKDSKVFPITIFNVTDKKKKIYYK